MLGAWFIRLLILTAHYRRTVKLNELINTILRLTNQFQVCVASEYTSGCALVKKNMLKYLCIGALYVALTNGAAVKFLSTLFWGKNDEGKVVVPFIIDSDSASHLDADRIKQAMDKWTERTNNTIQFVEGGEYDHFLSIIWSGNCSSTVGYAQDEQLMELTTKCSQDYRTVEHELGHVLGLSHEHERADRDEFITVNPDDRPKDVNEDQIEPDPEIQSVTDYDIQSVMHYFNTGNHDYISSKTETPISDEPNEINDKDTWAICHLYEIDNCKYDDNSILTDLGPTVEGGYVPGTTKPVYATRSTETESLPPLPSPSDLPPGRYAVLKGKFNIIAFHQCLNASLIGTSCQMGQYFWDVRPAPNDHKAYQFVTTENKALTRGAEGQLSLEPADEHLRNVSQFWRVTRVSKTDDRTRIRPYDNFDHCLTSTQPLKIKSCDSDEHLIWEFVGKDT